ncbi:MAG: DUF5034 domain-containing protein [Bacteroidota bacterium]
MKKLLSNSMLITIFYYLIVLANACCSCPKPKSYFFKIEDIHVSHIEFTFQGDTDFLYVQTNKDSFQLPKYGLQIQFDTKQTVQIRQLKSSLMNSAFACKCAEEDFIARDTLKNIRINTLQSFNSGHPIGSDVSEYFNYFEYGHQPTKLVKTSIADFIARHPLKSLNISIPLYLSQEPNAGNTKMQFEIVAEFKNGKILNDTTTAITLY